MAPPKTGHDCGLAVDGPPLRIDAGQAQEILAGKQQMLMAEEQSVNAVELGEVLTRIFLPRRRGEPGNARVTEHDDQIDAAPKFVELRARGLDDVDRGQAAPDMGLVPLSDLRRRDPDHAHSEPLRPSILVDQVALDHDRRRIPWRAVASADVA